MTLLRNNEATRARIEQEWRAIVGKGKAGDLVILSYAGHGGQEPDLAPLEEEDGLDESFLLPDFYPDPRHRGWNERIVDDTLHDWLKEAGGKGMKVIFIADACHSGTMTRGTPDRRATVTLRGRPPYGVPETVTLAQLKRKAESLPHTPVARDDDLAHVTFLSATQENRKAPEVVIGGQKRGALSYAFARAVQGAADSNGDGAMSRFELEAYVSREVRQLSEAQQAPDLRPRGGSDSTLIAVPAAQKVDVAAGLDALKLRIMGMDDAEAQSVASSLSGAVLVTGPQAADLVWDNAKQEVISGIGDPVAHDIDRTRLQGVVDKWRALPALKQLVVANPVDIRIEPDDGGRQPAGKEIAIASAPLSQPFVTVIDLQPDGTMQLLYPIPSDPAVWPSGKPYVVPRIRVQQPFGADHVLLISSSKRLVGLQANLSRTPVAGFAKELEAALQGQTYQIGLVGLYTYASP